MASLFQQAQAAIQQQNWYAVGHLVEAWLNQELTTVSSESSEGDLFLDASAQLDTSAQSEELVLSLALQVLTFGDFQARWDIAKVFPKFGNAAIAPLIDLLHNDALETQARWYAARILGGFAHPQSIQALIAAVQSYDDDLSRMAATALANLGIDAIAALTPLLDDPATRSIAVSSLCQISHSSTIGPLLSVVQDSDPHVRTIALEALSSFHDVRVPPALVKALNDSAASVRRVAILGLGFRTDLTQTLDLVQLLGDRLRDHDLSVCQQAATALGRLGTPAAADLLFETLRSPEIPPSLQLDIVRSLAWTGQPSALSAFHAMLCPVSASAIGPDRSPRLLPPLTAELCLELIRVVGQWSIPALKLRATEILIDTLSHSPSVTPEQQPAIALALGELGEPQAIEPLIQGLTTPDQRFRLHIIAALKRLNASLAYARLTELATSNETTPSLKAGSAIALQEW